MEEEALEGGGTGLEAAFGIESGAGRVVVGKKGWCLGKKRKEGCRARKRDGKCAPGRERGECWPGECASPYPRLRKTDTFSSFHPWGFGVGWLGPGHLEDGEDF